MKKFLPLLILVIPFNLSAQQRVAYHDAAQFLKLYREYQLQTPARKIEVDANVIAIIRAYYNADDMEAVIDANPYLHDYFSINGAASLRANGLLKTFSEGTSWLGGLNVTKFADGFAKVLVEHAKEELNIYFFDRFNNFLNDKKYANDLKILFPKTHAVMLLAGNEIYNYQQYLQALREAFAHDLTGLLSQTNQWINKPVGYSAIVDHLRTLAHYPHLQFALEFAVQLQQGSHPGDILLNLQNKPYTASISADFKALLTISNILSQSLRSREEGNYWISAHEFNAFSDPDFLKIYLGLISLKAKAQHIPIGSTNFYDLIISLKTNIDDVIRYYADVSTVLTEADHLLMQIRTSTQTAAFTDYASIANYAISFAERLMTIPAVSNVLPNSFISDDFRFYLQRGANLLTDVRTHSYSAAVFEVGLIIQKANSSAGNDFVPGFLKYGSFMANMANAETSEDVKNAIEAAALPAGSSRVKRETTFNIELNGYVSGFWGNEKYSFEENGVRSKRWRDAAGLTAPIGVAFSVGLVSGKCNCNYGSLTLFGSLVDLGAIASFRFKDPDVEALPEVKLANIFSPGAFLIYGIPKTPLSVGYGWQYGPTLRNIDAQAATVTNEKFYGWRLFIGVDIPLFNLYTKPRK